MISQFHCALTKDLEFLPMENTDKWQFANLEFFDLLSRFLSKVQHPALRTLSLAWKPLQFFQDRPYETRLLTSNHILCQKKATSRAC